MTPSLAAQPSQPIHTWPPNNSLEPDPKSRPAKPATRTAAEIGN